MKKGLRYTEEQKQEALTKIETMGLSKTAKDMGITFATLSRWKKEAVPQKKVAKSTGFEVKYQTARAIIAQEAPEFLAILD